MKAVNDDNANIIKLDWSRPEFCPGTILYQLLTESLEFCLNALKQDIWQSGRSDHKYLCQLVVVFLGGQVPGKFRFHQPQACHQARWFACAIYFLVITMTGNYYKLEPDVKKQMEIGAEYVAFFHAKFFLQASLPAVAPASGKKEQKRLPQKHDQKIFQIMCILC